MFGSAFGKPVTKTRKIVGALSEILKLLYDVVTAYFKRCLHRQLS